jgi:hypothetical protein
MTTFKEKGMTNTIENRSSGRALNAEPSGERRAEVLHFLRGIW